MSNTSRNILFVLLLVTLVSCGENNNDSENEVSQTNLVEKNSSKKKTSNLTYSPKGDCDSFIQSVDFSSLCFTEKTTPEYEVELTGDRSCQFEFFADDKQGNIHMSITYSDYENSVYAKDGDKEMPKLMFEQSFKQKRNSKMFYTKSTGVKNLGDDAFIGYNENRNEKAICVRISNVSFTIQLNQTDEKQTCLMSDDELIKFGRIIVEAIQK